MCRLRIQAPATNITIVSSSSPDPDQRLVTVHRRSEYTYRPAWWVPGAHAQTLWGKFFRRRPEVPTRRERWTTPDGDFLDVHRHDAPPGSPRLVLDMTKTRYIDSMFIETVFRAWKRIQERKGTMALCCPNEMCAQVLTITNLNRLWPVCATRAEAIRVAKG